MNLREFDYDLPAERIAQFPEERRDASRLMVVDRHSGEMGHHRFGDLVGLLREGDLLVFNDTRVLPARLLGRKQSGGRVELLLVEPVEEAADPARWRGLVRCSHGPAPGLRLEFAEGLAAIVERREGDGWRVRLEAPDGKIEPALRRVGTMPLPPYIRRQVGGEPPIDDHERYQTVYARRPGAIAAPTAGLHFTTDLLDRLDRAGVVRAFLTLHVGPGTFVPVRTNRVEGHRMLDERYDLPDSVARAVDEARRRGSRVVAVGTTVVRTLETRATEGGRVRSGNGRSDLFIYPGYRFRVVDALLTNFHLPRSTLIMLACAFAGRDHLLSAYREAIARGYRFYSYGDAMLLRST